MATSTGRLLIVIGVSLAATLGFASAAEAAVDTITVTSLADPGDGDCATNGCTLREAITRADDGDTDLGGFFNPAADVDQIVFESGLGGRVSLNGTELPPIDEPLYIHGPGAGTLTVDGNDSSRILEMTAPGTIQVKVEGLTLANGRVTGGGVNGGAIRNNTNGKLTIQESVITDSHATSDGGGVYTVGPTVVLRSTVSGNSANRGGGLFASGLTIERSTISGNDANGIFSTAGPTVRNSTISGNAGAAVIAEDGVITYGSTVAGNDGGIGAGGVLVSTVVADNAGSDLLSNVSSAFSLIENPGGHAINALAPNIIGSGPQLGPLAANGGPTQTMMPAPTSPAIDQGYSAMDLGNLPAIDQGVDQRGQLRVFDVPTIANAAGDGPEPNESDGSDIGAVELQASEYVPPAAAPTGQRDAAIKKCKKKHKKNQNKKQFKKCKKKAKKLPV